MGKFKLGLRNIKTAICIVFCVAFSYIIGSKEAIFFCGVASVLCMKQSHSESLKTGVFLFLGTVYGGLLGLASLWISSYIPEKYSQLEFVIIMIAIFLGIYGCNATRANAAMSITCIILLKVTSAFYGSDKSYTEIIEYLLSVVLFFTLIGIIFAIIVNRYIYPVKEYEDQLTSDSNVVGLALGDETEEVFEN